MNAGMRVMHGRIAAKLQHIGRVDTTCRLRWQLRRASRVLMMDRKTVNVSSGHARLFCGDNFSQSKLLQPAAADAFQKQINKQASFRFNLAGGLPFAQKVFAAFAPRCTLLCLLPALGSIPRFHLSAFENPAAREQFCRAVVTAVSCHFLLI